METIWEHDFRDGSKISLLYKEFKQAKKEVPTLQFFFQHAGRNTILEVPFFDRHQKADLLPGFVEAAQKWLAGDEQEQSIIVTDAPKVEKPKKPALKTKTCVECKREFIPNSPAQKKCNICRMPSEKQQELKEKLEAEIDEPEVLTPDN